MTWVEIFTLASRQVAVMAMIILLARLWRARRSDGALLRAFVYQFGAVAVTQGWYVIATLSQIHGFPEVRVWMLKWAFPLWWALTASHVWLWHTLMSAETARQLEASRMAYSAMRILDRLRNPPPPTDPTS
jgi:hypothetical protein